MSFHRLRESSIRAVSTRTDKQVEENQMNPMTSRQRVIAAIAHQQPDRVPIDLNISLSAYRSLTAYMGLDVKNYPAPNTAMEVIPNPAVLSQLGVDLISVKLGDKSTFTELAESFTDSWGVTRKLVRQLAGEYYETTTHPLAQATINDLAGYPWPKNTSPQKSHALAENAQKLYEQTDLALVGRFGGPILELAADLLGMEQWYIRLGTDKPFVIELLNRISDICTDHDLLGLEVAGQYVQIIKVSGEDFGMQTGPLYSRTMFEDILMPPLKRRWHAVRKAIMQTNPQTRIMLHSCGAVRSFIPDFIAAGIDILDPVQPLAEGMEPQGLKDEFGNRIVFHGGMDIQNLLPKGTPQEITIGTRQCLHGFQADSGGFILAPSHNLQADVPPQNIIAMIEATKTWPS